MKKCVHIFSFPGHGLYARHILRLLSHLNHGAQRAAEVSDDVAHQRTLDSFLLPQLLSVQSAKDDERKSEERSQSAEHTTFTESLGIFAEGVTRDDVGDDADAAVVEATAKSVLPIRHLYDTITGEASKEGESEGANDGGVVAEFLMFLLKVSSRGSSRVESEVAVILSLRGTVEYSSTS